MLVASDWESWYQDRVTQQFLWDLERTKVRIMEAWAAGGYTSEDKPHAATQLNSKALGEVGMLDQVIGLIMDCQPQDPQPQPE